MLTLASVQQATNTAAVTDYLETVVLPGTGWALIEARRRYVRLEPPETYWAMYEVRLGRGEARRPQDGAEALPDSPTEAAYPEERELRLVARASFKPEAWANYAERVSRLYGDRDADPLGGLGVPRFFHDSQHVIWFFPVDPSLPALAAANDPSRVLRLFRTFKRDLLDVPARIRAVDVRLAKYVPEINGIFEYTLHTQPTAAGRRVFGKVQVGERGRRTWEVMSRLWQAARASDERLSITRPIGYYPALALYLEEAAEGKAVGGDRTAEVFQRMAVKAAEACATIQQSGIQPDSRYQIEDELTRLDQVLDQFALVHPSGHFLLRELLLHVRSKLARTSEEDLLPCHGDLKYDQFIVDAHGELRLIDFDYFTLAETSADLARFSSYVFPSMPLGWEQSIAGEAARKAFLDRYREIRPDATLQRFQLYEAVMLALRAMTTMWSQQRGWEAAIEALLVMAMERLNSRLP
ncbi:MAG TPA: hypothetical protein VF070_18045 [Streptosporangiaceae bacterium]